MYLIQVCDECGTNECYMASTLVKVKEVIHTICDELMDDDTMWDDGEPKGWASLYDELEGAATYEDVGSLIMDFACDTGVVFRFFDSDEGVAMELMS